MNGELNHIELGGCSPIPLAHYLKALGVLRIITEQADADARGYWKSDKFVIATRLNESDLLKFLLDDYVPTPIVAPWNGGSGFYYQEEKLKGKDPETGKRIKTGRRNQPTTATKAVDGILVSTTHRLAPYRKTLSIAKKCVDQMGLVQAPEKTRKKELMQTIRNHLPNTNVDWIDASVLLTSEDPKYPPLLGTGGNDGNADFSSNFMQRLGELIDLNNGSPSPDSKRYLNNALFVSTIDKLLRGVVIGQFFPNAAGGVNSTVGFDSDSFVNPWDYILMLEGTLLFAASSAKKLGNANVGALSYPFSVRPVGVGYGSSSQKDEKDSRSEIWVPIWTRPASIAELSAIMSEGRANIGRRPARNGVDFARAIAGLGVDRGIGSFQRYGFQVRNGRSYFAIPMGRFIVRRQPQVDLLREIDRWLPVFRRKATSKEAPASAGRALRRLEGSILTLCENKGSLQVQDVLISLGECEKAMVTSKKWTSEVAHLKPVPPLSAQWLEEADDGSSEFRLASSLASVYGPYQGRTIMPPIRSNLEPTHTWLKEGHLHVNWNKEESRDVVWSEGEPVNALNNIMSRRIIRAQQSGVLTYPDLGVFPADLGDIADFIEDRVDLHRMVELLWGLTLIDWAAIDTRYINNMDRHRSMPGASYMLLKLCYPGFEVRGVKIPLVPDIHRKASMGDGITATKLAVRRLTASELSSPLDAINMDRDTARRTAAALLFPIDKHQLDAIADRMLRPEV